MRVGVRIIFGPDNAYLRDQFADPLETGIASAVAAPGDNRGSKVSQDVSVRRARSLSAKLDFEHAARLALN
jgi:hypothetical protein